MSFMLNQEIFGEPSQKKKKGQKIKLTKYDPLPTSSLHHIKLMHGCCCNLGGVIPLTYQERKMFEKWLEEGLEAYLNE